MAVKITYFVHGTTLDNMDNKAAGWLPGQLSPKGIEQVLSLKKQIDVNQFDIVFCSDLQRAVDSANYIFGRIKEIIVDERLRECNYGDWNGKNNDLIVYEDYIYDTFPNGECMLDVENRVRDFCEFLLKEYDGKHIAIVAHRAPQLAFQVITEGKSWQEAIDTDWRKTKSWQAGWNYILE